MTFGELWGVALGTAVALAMVLGLFYLKRVLRRRFFSDLSDSARDRAMSELLQLQARLQGPPSFPGTRSSEAGEGAGEGLDP